MNAKKNRRIYMEKSERDDIYSIIEEKLAEHHFRVLDGDATSVIITSLMTGKDYEVIITELEP